MARMTMREAISQALWEEMERDPKVFIMGEEVGVWGGTYAVTKGFLDHFGGDRVLDEVGDLLARRPDVGEIDRRARFVVAQRLFGQVDL